MNAAVPPADHDPDGGPATPAPNPVDPADPADVARRQATDPDDAGEHDAIEHDAIDTTGPAPMERRLSADARVPADETVERRQIVVRRAPRFAPFLVGGALIGFLVAAVFVFPATEDPNYTPAAAFGFFAMLFGILGVALGALVALLLDRRSHRRARRASADEVTGTRR